MPHNPKSTRKSSARYRRGRLIAVGDDINDHAARLWHPTMPTTSHPPTRMYPALRRAPPADVPCPPPSTLGLARSLLPTARRVCPIVPLGPLVRAMGHAACRQLRRHSRACRSSLRSARSLSPTTCTSPGFPCIFSSGAFARPALLMWESWGKYLFSR